MVCLKANNLAVIIVLKKRRKGHIYISNSQITSELGENTIWLRETGTKDERESLSRLHEDSAIQAHTICRPSRGLHSLVLY